MQSIIRSLDDLARTDPVAAPLAILTAEALRAASVAAWRLAVPVLDPVGLSDGQPLLAGATFAVDASVVRGLVGRLSVLACSGVSGRSDAIASLPDPLFLLEAGINQDSERLAELAEDTGSDFGLLATLGHLASIPLLHACGESTQALRKDVTSGRGYCPVCGAWPVISELRGNFKERWLHCGRCGTAWPWSHLSCAYCGNDSHETLGYLAPELSLESRRATTCELCHGYLKSVSTLLPMDLGEVILKDLSTLELDAAALDRGYSRPTTPGYALGVRIKANL